MKRVSQNDLQKMYEAPSSDLEERIHQTIASLPVQVQEGKAVKRKWFMSAVLALVLILAVGAIGLAGSGIFGNRAVDYDGNVTESEGVTDVQVQELQTEFTDLDKLLEIVPDGEYGIVLDQNNEARADRWRRTVRAGVTFISDCYNANPTSMVAALETFAAAPCAGRRVAVLGDMFELGEESVRLHAEVKRKASSLPLDKVIYVGQNCGGVSFDEAKAALFGYVRPGDAVLLKASHGMAFGRMLEP